MNVRKNIDYSPMYRGIDEVMAKMLPQMQMYTAIGKIVCSRSEKGAAVMASEYVRTNYPDVQGFSPRNLRRMRDFWRTYEEHPTLLSLAMELGRTQNVVIMEADLTMEIREWYLRAARQFDWSKTELIASIEEKAHLHIELDEETQMDSINANAVPEGDSVAWIKPVSFHRRFIFQMLCNRCRGSPHGQIVEHYNTPNRMIRGIMD